MMESNEVGWILAVCDNESKVKQTLVYVYQETNIYTI